MSSEGLRDWSAAQILRLLPLSLAAPALLGLAAVWVRRRRRVTAFLLIALFAGLVPWLTKDFHLRNPDSHAYVMIPIALVGLLALLGLAEFLAIVERVANPRIRGFTIGLVCLAFGLSGIRGSAAWLAHAATDAEILSRHLDAAPPRAVFLVASDHWLFPLWHRQTVEGRRPDVTVVAKGMLSASWYRRQVNVSDASRPRFEEVPDHPGKSRWGFLFGTGDYPGRGDFFFVNHCRAVKNEDPFRVRESICAQVILTSVRQRTSDQAGIGSSVALLETCTGVSPTGVSCYPTQPITLPFPLYEELRFLADPDEPVTVLAKLYLGCRRPDLALTLLGNRASDVNGTLLKSSLLFLSGNRTEALAALEPSPDRSTPENRVLRNAAQVLKAFRLPR